MQKDAEAWRSQCSTPLPAWSSSTLPLPWPLRGFSLHRLLFFRLSVIFIALFASDSQSKKYVVLLRGKVRFYFSLSSSESLLSSRPLACCSNMENFRGLVRVQERIPMISLILGGPCFSHCKRSTEDMTKYACSILLIYTRNCSNSRHGQRAGNTDMT